ncbi:MAG: LacI family transcriptional regulator [Clostridiales bacterium]|nr:LacI family transcriptional regulator [Clostridiales bacterium]
MITLFDIAEKAGVSKATVSRVLKQDINQSVSENTRKKVLKAAAELGYQSKRVQKDQKQNIVIIHKNSHYQSTVDNAFNFSVRYGIENTCRSCQVNYSFIPNTMLHLLPHQIDGFIVNGNYNRQQKNAIQNVIQGIPSVEISRINAFSDEIDQITYDVQEAVYLAMTHLKDQGCISFLYIGVTDYEGTPDHLAPIIHYRQYMAEHSDLINLGEIEGEHGVDNAYNMMLHWLKKAKTIPEAIFASNDPLAYGVVRALLELGIQIPSQTHVIGINGDSFCEISMPSLSTVCIHPTIMGQEAVFTLLNRISVPRDVTKRVLLRPKLIQRQSTYISNKNTISLQTP